MVKKFIKRILYRIDFFKAPLLLRSKQEPRVSTTAFGIFSLLLFAFFAYVFIQKAINIMNTDSSELKSSGYLQRSQNTTYAKNMMFSLGIDYQYLTHEEFSNYFQLYAFTANSTEVVQGFAKWNKIQMIPCNKQLWSLVSVDVEKYYPFQSYYCLPSVSSSITVQYDKNFLKIQLLKCTTKPTCKSSSEIDQLFQKIVNSNSFFPIYVAYLNSYPQLTQPNALKYAVQTFIYFTPTSTIQKVFLKFDQLKIKTDTSYWPIYSNVQESQALTFAEAYYAFQEKTALNNNSFIKIQLSLTNDEIVYQRTITKMDDALSYVGGLLGLVAFILIFLLKSYNQYKYELHVAENSFNYDTDGYKIREEDLGMFKYLRYRVYYIIFLIFGKKFKWGDCPEMHETIYEAKKLLDVEGMYRRLDMMERAVWYRFDFDYLLMDTLQKPDTIQQVNKKRRTMQYYQQVINMQNAATVQDAVNKDSKSFQYLDESNRKLSQKRISIYSLLNKMSLNNAGNQDLNKNEDIETEMQIEKSLKQDLNLHGFEQQCQSVSNYPLIYLEAKEMELDEQYDQIEEEITQSFKNLSYESKKKLLNKIPMKILHRLRLRAIKMNKQKNSQEKKEQNMQQEQKNQTNKFISVDRGLSLESLNSQERFDVGKSINQLRDNEF